VLPQLVGHSSFNYALGHLSAAYVSLVILAEPVGSTILAVIFLHETPTPLQIVGAALILFAVVYARQAERTESQKVKRVEAGLPGG
jgi:drug/metabolite transporter (DMT)-like permease